MQPTNWSVLGPAGDSNEFQNVDSHMDVDGLATHSSSHLLVGGTLSRPELDSLHLHLDESELEGNYYDETEEEEPPQVHSKNGSDQKKKSEVTFLYSTFCILRYPQ